jgi:hypothetical protein
MISHFSHFFPFFFSLPTLYLFVGDNEPLKLFYDKMKNEKLMQKPKYEHPVILRGNLLVHAHVLRLTNLLTPVSNNDDS